MSVTVKIETGGLTEFGARLRELLASFPIEEELALTACAELVRDDAKNRASGSEKTVNTIRVLPSPAINGKMAVRVGSGESGGSIYPLLREGGNGATRFKEWKHPTFGGPPTVTQKSDPYLEPALRAKTDEMEVKTGDAVEKLLDRELDGTF